MTKKQFKKTFALVVETLKARPPELRGPFLKAINMDKKT